ncbi:MAG: hypothetical protein WC054_01150 [Candidatus Nanopelagicales bacterium]
MSDVPDYDVQPRPRVAEDAISAHDLVIEDLQREFPRDTAAELAAEFILSRKQYGLEKYGTVLHSDNGRDYIKDILDEAGDLVSYLRVFLSRHPELVGTFGEFYRSTLVFVTQFVVAEPALRDLDALKESGS